jgi:hypothetical protein
MPMLGEKEAKAARPKRLCRMGPVRIESSFMLETALLGADLEAR